MQQKKLGEACRKILVCIFEYARDKGKPPTNREIADKVGLKNSGNVNRHLDTLEYDHELISRDKGSRNVKLTEKGSEYIEALGLSNKAWTRGIRLLGSTAASIKPRYISEEPEQILYIEDGLVDENVFALVVEGDSMIEEQIRDGDFVFLKQQTKYENYNVPRILDRPIR
ncbi:MAG TPA: S24 family peptidase [Ktedonobacteraceae bacterium]|nr:S24 family peptidase [Ktedonobacteraceae bacterium]